MRRIAGFLVVLAFTVPMLFAGELAEVKMEDEVTVGDARLTLNGMGLRKKMWVKVYVAGLYLESPSNDAAEAVKSDGAKRVVMHFLTNKAGKKKMDSAWIEGFKANSPSAFDALKERVEKFVDLFGDMKVGDVIELTMVPDNGTVVALNGEEKSVIEGNDFAAALLNVWLGDHPPTEELKTGMLGG